MNLLLACFALVTTRGVKQGAAQGAADSLIPSAPQIAAPADFLNWKGFGFLDGRARAEYKPYSQAAGWDQLYAKESPDPAVWKLRVFVVTRIDEVRTLPDGTLQSLRHQFDNASIKRIERAVGQLGLLVRDATLGAVRIEAKITTDPESYRLGRQNLRDFLIDYVTPRFNGGRFDADDREFRGPYQSFFVFHPALVPDAQEFVINGTPGTFVAPLSLPEQEADGRLAAQLQPHWQAQLRVMAWNKGMSQGQPAGVENWRNLFSQESDEVVPESTDAAKISPTLFANVFRSPEVNASVVTDPEQGESLLYSEKGFARAGGIALPRANDDAPLIDVQKTPTLSFYVKSSSRDPLAITFVGMEGKKSSVSIGRDLPGKEMPSAAFETNGKWQELKIDLRATGLGQIRSIQLEPSASALLSTKSTLGPIEYYFSGFRLSSDQANPFLGPRQANEKSLDVFERAKAAQTTPDTTRLKDLSDIVRLNAIQPYLTQKNPAAEPALIELATLSYDSAVAIAAVDALEAQQSPTASAALHAVLRGSVNVAAKGEVARLLAAGKDVKVASELIPLLENPSLQTRIEAVRALSQFPGRESAIIRMSFLQQSDPQLKLEVTKTTDPKDDYQARKLLWSLVNEASDSIRILSAIKLLDAADASFRAEAYKAVRDDSVWVRISLLEYLAANPRAEAKSAIDLGLADRHKRVREAAERAKAGLSKQ